MIKLFGFRLSLFFLFILGLECLALLISIYLGLILFQGTSMTMSFDINQHAINTSAMLMVLIGILTPGFFFQVKTINKIKQTLKPWLPGLFMSILMMTLIVVVNLGKLDAAMVFVAAVFSACIGLLVNQFGLLGRYWRFLIRSGVN